MLLCSELIFFSLSITLYCLPLMLVNKVDQLHFKQTTMQGKQFSIIRAINLWNNLLADTTQILLVCTSSVRQ